MGIKIKDGDEATKYLKATGTGADATTNAYVPIQTLGANSGVDIGDVDVTSIAAGDNNIGNVDVVTLPALVAGSAAIGKLAANSGVDIGDVDVTSLPALAAGTAAIGATKDNGPQIGAAEVGETAVPKYVESSAMHSGAVDIGPAPAGGQKSVLLQITVSTDAAILFTMQKETTPAAERHAFYLPANGSVIFVPRYPIKLSVADKKWQVIASGSANIRVTTVTTSEA